jgi:hypothetical protein
MARGFENFTVSHLLHNGCGRIPSTLQQSDPKLTLMTDESDRSDCTFLLRGMILKVQRAPSATERFAGRARQRLTSQPDATSSSSHTAGVASQGWRVQPGGWKQGQAGSVGQRWQGLTSLPSSRSDDRCRCADLRRRG